MLEAQALPDLLLGAHPAYPIAWRAGSDCISATFTGFMANYKR